MAKMILVTGATGNLGTTICKKLSTNGYKVVGTRRPHSEEQSDYAEMIDLDLLDEKAVENTIASLRKKQSTIDGLICLAGGFAMSNITSATDDELMKMYKLNFLTAYHIVKPVYQWMSEQRRGRIVLTGSKPAVEGGGFELLPYALSKGSVVQLASVLNEKSNETGVVSSVIVPSIIDTPPNRKAMPDADPNDWVKPEEIAATVLSLISDEHKSLRQPLMKIYGNS